MQTRRFVLLGAALILALVSVTQAAGTAVVTVTRATGGAALTRYAIAWTSSAGGAVSANTFTVGSSRLVRIDFVPGTAGSQPTDLYDVTLVDANGVDLLNGRGADRSNSTSSVLLWDPVIYHDSRDVLDLQVANAGNAKTGTVYLYTN